MLRFVGNGDQKNKKSHQKYPPFFNAKFPGELEEKIHKSFLESRQSKKKKKEGARKPFANPSPTFSANPSPTFPANLSPTFSANRPLSEILFPWGPGTRLETPVNGFLVFQGWDLARHLQSPKARNPEKSQKSLPKGVWDPPTPDPQKVPKKVRKVKKIVDFDCFSDFSDFLGVWGRGVPNSFRETFLGLFGVSGFWAL